MRYISLPDRKTNELRKMLDDWPWGWTTATVREVLVIIAERLHHMAYVIRPGRKPAIFDPPPLFRGERHDTNEQSCVREEEAELNTHARRMATRFASCLVVHVGFKFSHKKRHVCD